ncbi:MAG TPA: hypothetical protein VE397_16305 [Stellaceae bacterium]|nr:hypothetical protein [Stellaceae bacterium]
MAAWLAYLLGLLTWLPIIALAVLTGRLLAWARETQTRPAAAKSLKRLAPPGAPESGDDPWAVAWADALN